MNNEVNNDNNETKINQEDIPTEAAFRPRKKELIYNITQG